MTRVQLECIVAVDPWHHFAAAAAKCFLSQLTLSMQLKKVEAELGVQIFDRSKVPVAPTAAGVEIIQQARVILQEVQRLSEGPTRAPRRDCGRSEAGEPADDCPVPPAAVSQMLPAKEPRLSRIVLETILVPKHSTA
jgi:DNA-binding transcriptional LysR family regulator